MSRKMGLGLCCLAFLLAAGSRAYSQSRIEKDLKLDPGGRLVVEAGASDVFVTGRPESGAHVVVTSNRADLEDLFTFRFDEEPGGVRIEVRKRSVQPWPKSLQVRLEAQVSSPARARELHPHSLPVGSESRLFSTELRGLFASRSAQPDRQRASGPGR
jgi:hypothetical protein